MKKHLSTIWDIIVRIVSVLWKIGLVILIFLFLGQCAKEEQIRRDEAEQEKMASILNDLEETGNIEGYGNYEDGIYVRIPYDIVKDIESVPYEHSGYEYCMEDYAYFVSEYIERNKAHFSDEELDVIHDMMQYAVDTELMVQQIELHIPWGY